MGMNKFEVLLLFGTLAFCSSSALAQDCRASNDVANKKWWDKNYPHISYATSVWSNGCLEKGRPDPDCCAPKGHGSCNSGFVGGASEHVCYHGNRRWPVAFTTGCRRCETTRCPS